MALSSEQLSGVKNVLEIAVGNPAAKIRAGFPGLRVTMCDAEDMRGEPPFARIGGYDLFLIDTASHCWQIVRDPQSASGIVIAAHA